MDSYISYPFFKIHGSFRPCRVRVGNIINYRSTKLRAPHLQQEHLHYNGTVLLEYRHSLGFLSLDFLRACSTNNPGKPGWLPVWRGRICRRRSRKMWLVWLVCPCYGPVGFSCFRLLGLVRQSNIFWNSMQIFLTRRKLYWSRHTRVDSAGKRPCLFVRVGHLLVHELNI